jgi:hypothetical protein
MRRAQRTIAPGTGPPVGASRGELFLDLDAEPAGIAPAGATPWCAARRRSPAPRDGRPGWSARCARGARAPVGGASRRAPRAAPPRAPVERRDRPHEVLDRAGHGQGSSQTLRVPRHRRARDAGALTRRRRMRTWRAGLGETPWAARERRPSSWISANSSDLPPRQRRLHHRTKREAVGGAAGASRRRRGGGARARLRPPPRRASGPGPRAGPAPTPTAPAQTRAAARRRRPRRRPGSPPPSPVPRPSRPPAPGARPSSPGGGAAAGWARRYTAALVGALGIPVRVG